MAQTPSMGGYAKTPSPTAGYDAALQQWYIKEIERLRAAGKSTKVIEEQQAILQGRLGKAEEAALVTPPGTSPADIAGRFGAAHLARRRASARGTSIGRTAVSESRAPGVSSGGVIDRTRLRVPPLLRPGGMHQKPYEPRLEPY